MQMPVQEIQFVLGAGGKPSAVLINISLWERILEALEDAEDVTLAKDALALLDAAGGDPEQAGFTSWEKAKSALEKLDVSQK